jgi:phosphoesterase RecJ-like protein
VSGSAAEVAAALLARQTFILTSHARPDGDAIGSSVALALALEQLGKQTRVVLRDPVPAPYAHFPAIERIEQRAEVARSAEAAVLLECSEITRPDIAGLDAHFVVNVDHHLGNRLYGAVNWFDSSAAACAELVADLIDALGAHWTPAIAAHLYLGIATDTGSFRYGPVSTRTFEICRRVAACGVDTSALARQIFDSYSIGRIRLTGAMLDAMELHHDRQLAVLAFDDGLLARCEATVDDTEGLVNLPLGAREILAVALIKRQAGRTYRLSLRSNGTVDVRAVAALWQGGGHQNAAGCTIEGDFDTIKADLVAALGRALDEAADRNAERSPEPSGPGDARAALKVRPSVSQS